MERNWLIRTAQNQILGPVAKTKLLEFIQKGALGLMDEVCSGNGYWFSLKEKDLVEKYIYGDIPQGYNPISESPSVISRMENPEKTTSINTAPANNASTVKPNTEAGITPSSEDLDFPDFTVVTKGPALNLESEETKLPAEDDLEFPDVGKISSAVKESFINFTPTPTPASVTNNQGQIIKLDLDAPIKSAEELKAEQEAIILPPDDDLAFPDLDKTKTKVEKGKVDLSHQYTRTVALDTVQKEEVLPNEDEINDFISQNSKTEALTLTDSDAPSANPFLKKSTRQQSSQSVEVKKELKILGNNNEDKKLLHERKTRQQQPIKTGAALRDPSREVNHVEVEPEPLKKRNDNYIFFILIILILIILAIFFYFKEILNKPLPV
jgi:hypothetical protein